MPSVITPKQKERLLNRPPDESDEKTLHDRRLNDFYVKKALKRWIESIEDVNIALSILPEKQTRALFKDVDIFRLLEITERALVYLNFMPIKLGNDKRHYAEKSIVADPESGSPRDFSESRPATDQDYARFCNLRKYLARFTKFELARPWAIYDSLDKIYYKDLIKKATKDGYEPAEPGETPLHHWLPRLTDEERWFRNQQSVLIGLGFEINSPKDLKALREKNRLERLREEEEYRALGVPSVEEMIESARQAPPPKYNCRKPDDEPNPDFDFSAITPPKCNYRKTEDQPK